MQLEDREREASRENTDRKIRGSDRPSSSRPSVQSSSNKRARLEGPGSGHASANNLDADEPLEDSDEDDDSDSDDDDTAALMAELQKIKREKAQEEQEKVCSISKLSMIHFSTKKYDFALMVIALILIEIFRKKIKDRRKKKSEWKIF